MADLRPTTGGATDFPEGNNNYIPKLYSKKLLRNFIETSIFTDITNNDYEGEIKAHGSEITIRRDAIVTANDYVIGQDLTYEQPSQDSSILKIDKGVYTATEIKVVDEAQMDINLQEMYARSAAEQANLKVNKEVLGYMALNAGQYNQGATAGKESGNINLGTSAAPVVITIDNAVEQIVYMNQVLDETQCPDDNRWIVLPSWYCSLLKLGDLKRVDVTGDKTGVIRNGLIGMVDRTMIYRSPSLYKDSGNWHVQCGTKAATTFATQVTQNESLPNPSDFGKLWRSLLSYGREVVQADALSTLVCKPS